MNSSDIFGYFDSPDQQEPAFDPGLTTPCPFCTKSVGRTAIKTISVAPMYANRSYFYRAHKHCYETAEPDEIEFVDTLPFRRMKA